MKRVLSLVLVISLFLTCGIFCSAQASSLSASEILSYLADQASELSPNNKCSLLPTIYCSPRYKNPDNGNGYDLKKGLSAKTINEDTSGREYGLYFKFTPKGRFNTFYITRFDVTVSDSKGQILYVDGFDSFMVCDPGYYWAWNFFPLAGLFNNMKLLYGEVIQGKYTMDIYFNGLWAGKTAFTIKK